MQKFTRALTREIEVGGERVAVTLSAEGVSVRLVGLRRPPLDLDWPSIVCACAGRLPAGSTATPEEIAAALDAMHAGKEANPAPVLAAAPAIEIAPEPLLSVLDANLQELLVRLDTWMITHRARYHEGLLPPASSSELHGLSQAIGQPLPTELRQWLGWHNGQNDDLIGSFYQTFNLVSAAQIAAAWQDRQVHLEPGWDNAWIPLLDDYQGDLILLDPTYPGCAVREAWRGRHEYPVVAPTLKEWLQAFVSDVEAGRYVEDPERGEFHRG